LPGLQESLARVRDEFTDSTITCNKGKSKFKTHKVILAAKSEVFRKLLQISDVIQMPDCSWSEVRLVLDLIYTGEAKVEVEDEKRFLEILNQFKIDPMPSQRKKKKYDNDEDKCQPTLNSTMQVPPEILIKILQYLPTHDLLKNVARISKQFYELTKCPEVHLNVSLSETAQEAGALEFIKKAKHMTGLTLASVQTLKMRSSYLFNTDINIKKKGINVNKLLLAVCKHQHLRSILLGDTCIISASTFMDLSKSDWWQKLHKFDVEIDRQDLYRMQKNKEEVDRFTEAVTHLGIDGNLTEISLRGMKPFSQLYHAMMTQNGWCKLKNVQIYRCTEERLSHFAVKKKRLSEKINYQWSN
jgi:hypothetical protein